MNGDSKEMISTKSFFWLHGAIMLRISDAA